MEKALALQLQIRQNAEEISSTLSDMTSWEKKMREKDTALRRGQPLSAVRPRKTREGGTVKVASKTTTVAANAPQKPLLTPASLIDTVAPHAPSSSSVSVPFARGRYEQRDLEEAERELGNAEFKAGNFTAAVKCYTKCLGLKSNNYIGFSNRAMAYLKLKEYARAVSDCDCALKIEPAHVKSLLRRATGLNALGKHRAALLDLLAAQELEPSNKQVRGDIAQTREMLRAAVNRAPHSVMRSFDELLALHQQHSEKTSAASTNPNSSAEPSSTVANGIVEIDTDEADGVVQGPDPLPASFVPTVKPASDPTPTPSPPPAPEAPSSSSALPVPPPTHQAASTAHADGEETVRIPITLADDDGDDDDAAEGATADAVGPSGAPSVAPTSKPTTEPPATHRIAISGVDSDDETDDTVGQSPAAAPPSSTTAATSLKLSTVASSAAASKRVAVEKAAKGAKSTTGSGKKATTSPKKSPTKSSRGSVMGAYELEKALVQAQGDTSALRTLLASLSPSKDASRIFQTVMEPEAMVLLLDSLWAVLSAAALAPEAAPLPGDADAEDPAIVGGLTHDTFWQWCWALQACSSFSLLFSLVPREAKASLQQRLQQLQTRHPWAGHSKKMQTVLTKFGCSL